MRPAVRPVCSPAYAAEHAQTLAGAVAGWSALTFLDLLRPNEGWATWEDWFAVAGRPDDGTPRRLGLDSYTYVLEAAAAGHGIALGWRHFIERFLEAGVLVGLGNGFVEFDRAYYGVLTRKGRRKALARKCLAFLGLYRYKLAGFTGTRPLIPAPAALARGKVICASVLSAPEYLAFMVDLSRRNPQSARRSRAPAR